MTSNEVRHFLLNIHSGAQQLKVEILRSGHVRLTLKGDVRAEMHMETLEDLLLEAGASPLLSPELYEQLHWELAMMARSGE